ncbi:MAG: M20/M25/M40 family metallo-hydrolase [Armatimonadetes bacterium]|nr:M20/M25/M40 family metallo-hydrolase [Armatimonadota bacterium]MCX7967534.1 M20/M25/M40 family metallo-hydrolase [Armatimonadota bacterium]MDW8142947.1 M20/M25/M40 family metallo-hydrolase [Armatimonadota bacterium]
MPINRERFLSDFLELVRIPSPSGKEREVAQAVKAKVEAMGLTVSEDEAGKGFGGEQGNLIVKVTGNLEGVPPILLNAHLDTVLPCENVNPIVEGDKVRSDGRTILGADNKAGVCVLLEFLRVIKEDGIQHGPLEIVFTVAEETGLHGAKHLDYSLISAKVGFVLDSGPPINKVIVRAPSQKNLRAVVKGKSAHAGVSPEKGINAIQLAARAIASMRLGRIDQETTANIGIIRGGLATNIVPEEVEILGEARSHNPKKLEEQIAHMVSLLEKEAQRGGGKAEVEVTDVYRSFSVTEDDLPSKVLKAALAKMGLKPQWETTGGGSDANIFNEHGIKCVLICCGEESPHSPENERLDIPSALQSVELLVNIVTAFAQMDEVK